MLYKREIASEVRPYHILIRAVERRRILAEETDRFRFIFQMHAANIGSPALNLYRKDVIKSARALITGNEIPSKFIIVNHPSLVNILSFVLVGDHYHLCLIPNVKEGIPKYMQKLNGGFAKYFNLRHNRKGPLFESRYKIVPIQTNFQLDAIIRYINVINSLDVYQPKWRINGLNDLKRAFRFLDEYQFSSFPDLFGKRNSKIIAPFEVLEKYLGKELIGDREGYIKFIQDYLSQKMAISLYPLFLE